MNESHLFDPKVQEWICIMWEVEENRSVDSKQSIESLSIEVRKLVRSWGKKKAKQKRAKEDMLRLHLKIAQLELERAPQDTLK